jgi:hypothetical protein
MTPPAMAIKAATTMSTTRQDLLVVFFTAVVAMRSS